MARPPLKAKTRIENGQRVDIKTGEAYVPTPRAAINQPIPLSTLNSNPVPAKIAPPPVPTDIAGGLGEMDAFTKSLQARAQETKQDYQESKSGLDEVLKNRLSEAEIRINKEDAAGVNDLNSEVRGYTDALTREQVKLAREVEAAQTAAGTATATERDRQVAELNRRSYRTQADISVSSLAAQGRLADAQAAADRAITLEFGDQERKIAHWERLVEGNKELFTSAELREYETLRDTRKAKLDEERDVRMIELQEKIKQRDPLYQAQLRKLEQDIIAGSPLDVTNLGTGTPSENNRAAITALLGSKNIGAGTKTGLTAVLGVINAAEDLATANTGGAFTGVFPGGEFLGGIASGLGLRSEKAISNQGYLDAINLKVQQWASGASLTAQQTAQVNKLVPNVNDTDVTVRAKLNNLSNFMLTQTQSALQSEGVAFIPAKVDLFNDKPLTAADPLGLGIPTGPMPDATNPLSI